MWYKEDENKETDSWSKVVIISSPSSPAQTRNTMWLMGGKGTPTEYSSQTVPTDKPHTMSVRALYIYSSSSSSRSLKSPHSSPDHSPPSGHPIPTFPIIHSFGVPFSWEHLPGIPKKQTPKWRKDKQSSSSSSSFLTTLSLLLPPPPSTATTPTKSRSFNLRKKSIIGRCHRDPFIAALVECSKDNDDASCRGGGFWIAGMLSRSISDRLGFMNAYTSCKRSCAVSQSIISLTSEEGVPLSVQSRSPWSPICLVMYCCSN